VEGRGKPNTGRGMGGAGRRQRGGGIKGNLQLYSKRFKIRRQNKSNEVKGGVMRQGGIKRVEIRSTKTTPRGNVALGRGWDSQKSTSNSTKSEWPLGKRECCTWETQRCGQMRGMASAGSERQKRNEGGKISDLVGSYKGRRGPK